MHSQCDASATESHVGHRNKLRGYGEAGTLWHIPRRFLGFAEDQPSPRLGGTAGLLS